MKVYMYAVIILVLAVILGCQDIFTYSSLDFLERDPSTLSKAQQLLYAQQALSSGNDSAMNAALDVVNDLITDDPNNAELWLLAGDLKWALSHASIAMQNYLFAYSNEFPDPTDPLAVDAFKDYIDNELTGPGEIDHMREAARDYYYNADTDPLINATLHAMQMLNTGIGLLSWQLSLPLAGQTLAIIIDARNYIEAAINALIP